MSIIGWIILGALAGWIAGFITKGGYGFWGDILCGIIGAIIGGWVAGLLLGRDV
ncbi:MAG: GlsB/YeaQ/YmgE family stress response membrane protein, partial [Chloroflexi bacterium]|nr:GlsB/YeaQ/YmgE family stress response membrane protein [Chloroflexota bacterium]